MNRTILILLLFLSVIKTTLFAQNTSSFSLKTENKIPMSFHEKDSIYKNNPLCQESDKIVGLDTLYWSKYPEVKLDSIPQLKLVSANEMAKRALDIKHSPYYPQKPFNLLGTYRENEMRNDTMSTQHINTKVKVYDPAFTGNILPKAQTEKCNSVYQAPNRTDDLLDTHKNMYGGPYSNLYYALDLDFLRMYDYPGSNEMGGDRRLWDNRKHITYAKEDYRYYKAFKHDNNIYVVLVSTRKYSQHDYLPDSIKARLPKNMNKPENNEYKYLLINLTTNSIEKAGYYKIQSESSLPINIDSFEASYKLIGNQYFLDNVTKHNFEFSPRINHISLSGFSFHVDSVIYETPKVKEIKESEADPRNVNYIDQVTKKHNLKTDEKR